MSIAELISTSHQEEKGMYAKVWAVALLQDFAENLKRLISNFKTYFLTTLLLKIPTWTRLCDQINESSTWDI